MSLDGNVLDLHAGPVAFLAPGADNEQAERRTRLAERRKRYEAALAEGRTTAAG